MTEQLTDGYDYGISKVHYDKTHTIDRVMVHQVEGRKAQPGREWSRADVVNRIGKGDRFVTLPELKGRKTGELGQTVFVLRKKFIRTKPNESDSDNLARLPRILSSYGISRIHYANGYIDVVKVHKVNCQMECCAGCKWRSLDVVHRIKKGDQFVTLPRRNRSASPSGQIVEVYRRNRKNGGNRTNFIRSIPNGIAHDNLLRLPRLRVY